MSTMNQIVDQVLSEVYGYTATVDSSTYLMVAVDADDLSFTVANASQFSRGLIQIDDELILLDAADRNNNTLTSAYVAGRGVRGTTSASHSVGARVTMAPSIPRVQAVNAVEQTIRASGGLFAVGTTSFTYEAAVAGYPIPAEADTILSMSWLPSGSENSYMPIKRWTHDRFNNQVRVSDPIQPQKTVNVTYSKAPTVPTSDQDFSVSGLPASCEDVIRFGAAWRVMSFLEPASLLARTAEADALDSRPGSSGARMRVAQYLFQMYRQRLTEEIAGLNSKYPIRVHYGG